MATLIMLGKYLGQAAAAPTRGLHKQAAQVRLLAMPLCTTSL